MNNQCQIKLYGISRQHIGNGKNKYEIKESTFKITRPSFQPIIISYENILRYMSWIHGWGFINIDGFPNTSRSDVLTQIKKFIEENATSAVAGENVDNVMSKFIGDMLKKLTDTIEELSASMLSIDENPTLRMTIDMKLPPISLFALYEKLKTTRNIHDFIPQTSYTLLTEQLNYCRPYNGLLTGAFMRLSYLENPIPSEEVINYAMEWSHEKTFQPSENIAITYLKAEIADCINAIEFAITINDSTRKRYFDNIYTYLLDNMYTTYQLYLLHTKFDEIKNLHSKEALHFLIDILFHPIGNFLSQLMESNEMTYAELYHANVTQPMTLIHQNLETFHSQMCLYLQYTNNKLGFPYGMVDIISGYLFQILLILMTNLDQNITSKLCIHTFGCVIIDMFYQRLMSIWSLSREPVIPYVKNILTSYQLQVPNNISSLSQLNEPIANDVKYKTKAFIEREKLSETFYDFFLTYNFSFLDRHQYNLQMFAQKCRIHDKDINTYTFGADILSNLEQAITKLQTVSNDRQNVGINCIYLYDKSIITALIKSKGMSEVTSKLNHGSIYEGILNAISVQDE